ncbi:hypothetical protein Efla_006001 [Eimeria flavescens]
MAAGGGRATHRRGLVSCALSREEEEGVSVCSSNLAETFRALRASPADPASRRGLADGGPAAYKRTCSVALTDRGGATGGPPSPHPSGGSRCSFGRGPRQGPISGSAGSASEMGTVSFELPPSMQRPSLMLHWPASCTYTSDEGERASSQAALEAEQEEASFGMQLALLHEANKWFPHTNFYAKMKAHAQPAVDKTQAHRDAVTGRLRIGGSLFSLLLFMCVTLRQSSLEDIPVMALQMGGCTFILWAFLLTCVCSLPLMVFDVALGQASQGSVLKALNSLDRKLRGLGLAVALGGTTSAILQSFLASIVLHFIAGALGTVIGKRGPMRALCDSLSPAECARKPICVFTHDRGCELHMESAVHSFWFPFLTKSDGLTTLWNVLCGLLIWLLVIYLTTQAPRVVGAVGACVFPCLLALLPCLVVLELVGDGQEYGVGDLYRLPWREVLPPNELYFCILVLPLLVYMPGDGAIITVASYDKQTHNPLIISSACLATKWFVALMLLNVMYYAEGLSVDRQVFRRLFFPSTPQWIRVGAPGSTAYPVLCFAVARTWPFSWLVGLLLFVAFFIQRFVACWTHSMVQWSLVRNMRRRAGLKREGGVAPLIDRGREGPSSPLGFSCLRGQPAAASSGQRQQQPAAAAAAAEARAPVAEGCRRDCCSAANISPPAAAAAAAAAAAGSERATESCPCCGKLGRNERSCLLRFRFLRSLKGGGGPLSAAASEEETRPAATPFSKVLRLLRITGDSYEVEEDAKAAGPELLRHFKSAGNDANPLLVWWGGPEEEKNRGVSSPSLPASACGGEEMPGGGPLARCVKPSKLLCALLMFAPPAAISLLLLCFVRPMQLTQTEEQFTAPFEFRLLVHADLFVRLMLGSAKCVYASWVFGFQQQMQRVGLPPLLLLFGGLLSVAAIPLFRVAGSAASLLLLALLFVLAAAAVVIFKTASSLRFILRKERRGLLIRRGAPPAGRAGVGGGTSARLKQLHRSGARSLSFSLRCTYIPEMPLAAGGSLCERPRRRQLVRPSLLPGGPRGVSRQGPEAAAAAPRGEKGENGTSSRRRRAAYLLRLYVRLLRSNLYWAFIGNVELLRCSLNLSLSCTPSKPLPLLWGLLLKFAATPWLLAQLLEHAVSTVPRLMAAAEGVTVSLYLTAAAWVLFLFFIFIQGQILNACMHASMQAGRLAACMQIDCG